MSTPSASRSIRGASVVIRRPAAGPLRDKALALIGIVSLVPGATDISLFALRPANRPANTVRSPTAAAAPERYRLALAEDT